MVAGDYNHTNLKKSMPSFHQHVTVPARKDRTLDHFYTTMKGSYRSYRRAPLGESDHDMIQLVPLYQSKLKCEKPTRRTICQWSTDAIERLRDCFDYTDWEIFLE